MMTTTYKYKICITQTSWNSQQPTYKLRFHFSLLSYSRLMLSSYLSVCNPLIAARQRELGLAFQYRRPDRADQWTSTSSLSQMKTEYCLYWTSTQYIGPDRGKNTTCSLLDIYILEIGLLLNKRRVRPISVGAWLSSGPPLPPEYCTLPVLNICLRHWGGPKTPKLKRVWAQQQTEKEHKL